jgi:hypothetical protein
VAAIYLSIKVEENVETVSAEELARKLDSAEDSLLENEVLLLQGTRFQLMVFHPFTYLDSFLERQGQSLSGASNTNADITQLQARSRVLIRCAMCGDCGFLFSPNDIALASLVIAVSELAPQQSSQLQQLISSDCQQASTSSIFNAAGGPNGSAGGGAGGGAGSSAVAAGAPVSPSNAKVADPAALLISLQQRIQAASQPLDEAEVERLSKKLEQVCLGENAGRKRHKGSGDCGSPTRPARQPAAELSPW